MSKADDRAYNYAKSHATLGYDYDQTYDAVKYGYLQAEEDLALNIDDIEKIHTFLYAVKNNKTGAFTFTRLSDKQYTEVLHRFNEQRKK